MAGLRDTKPKWKGPIRMGANKKKVMKEEIIRIKETFVEDIVIIAR